MPSQRSLTISNVSNFEDFDETYELCPQAKCTHTKSSDLKDCTGSELPNVGAQQHHAYLYLSDLSEADLGVHSTAGY